MRRPAAFVRKWTAAAFLGILGAAVTGGAVAAGASTQTPPLDACTLVDESQLEAALGYPLDPGDVVVSTRTMSGCLSSASNPKTSADVGVLLTTDVDRNKRPFGDGVIQRYGKTRRIPQLGNRALFAFKGGRLHRAALRVVEGEKGVIVTLKGPVRSAAARETTQAIAELALSKLA